MKHNIVLGPPGTGKTTYLLNTVDKLFTDGVRPYRTSQSVTNLYHTQT